MFSATSLLVLACASAIAFNPQADKCTPAQIGNFLNNYPVQLPPVSLPPHNADYQVTIPTIPECVNGEAGVYASTCDTDLPPQAQFRDFNTLLVHRNGGVQGYGSVTVTVFCNA